MLFQNDPNKSDWGNVLGSGTALRKSNRANRKKGGKKSFWTSTIPPFIRFRLGQRQKASLLTTLQSVRNISPKQLLGCVILPLALLKWFLLLIRGTGGRTSLKCCFSLLTLMLFEVAATECCFMFITHQGRCSLHRPSCSTVWTSVLGSWTHPDHWRKL